jgi:hypothetical protein
VPPPAPLRGALAGLRPAQNPQEGGGLAASPHMGGGFNCHAANSRIPSFPFYVGLGSPGLQVVALSARRAEISLPPPAAQSEPFFGLFGPSGRPRGPLPPSNCAKIAGVGASPPLRRPLRRYLAGLSEAHKKLRLRRKIEGNRSPRRTALKIPQKVPGHNSLPL